MKQYIVVTNIWGKKEVTMWLSRDVFSEEKEYFDTLEEARQVAKEEYEIEYDIFLNINKGEIYQEACGEIVNNNMKCIGFSLNSSKHESENMFFRSIIIEREV